MLRRYVERNNRKFSAEAHVSCLAIQRTLKDYIKIKPYKTAKQQRPSDPTMKKRFARSKFVLNMVRGHVVTSSLS